MINKKTFLRLFLFLTLGTFSLHAESEDLMPALEQQDIDALRDWVKTRKRVSIKEKGGNLSISGEVRTELQSTNEKKNGIKQRGSGGAVKDTASHAWDVEVNLMLTYKADRTWANIKLEFDNNAGLEGGTFNKLKLERAFFGGRIIDADLYTIDLEFGRRHLSYTFDSFIQFGSFMDGILLKYSHAFSTVGDFYFNGGPFLVNETLDHYAYVGELGLLNIGQTGFYTKLSYIDWDTKNMHNEQRNHAFSFRNFQLILAYKFEPDWLSNKVTTLYAAGLVNTAAPQTKITHYKRQNNAWYVGFSIGTLRKQWDWSLNINYQWVQAQAVPDFDGNGIGRGNAAKMGLYSKKQKGQGEKATIDTTVGAGNYKGLSAVFQYNLTSNITVYQSWSQSVNYDSSIGPDFSYKQYEIELIYAF